MTEATPNRVTWEHLEQPTYDDMVSVLISRLYPSAERIDGSGGDGGRDVQIRTDDGLLIFQLKSFRGRIDRRRRPKVEESLRTAAQHSPIKWHLVVPIDPTPGELEWFDSLADRFRFECCWLGKTWLDSELAQKPDIARYYAHGQRYEMSELFDLLRAINAEPPPLRNGVVGEAAGRVHRIVQALNGMDPHYVFGLTAQPDGQMSISMVPRYRGAERDRPARGRIHFDFPDTAEAAHVQQRLQESLAYGTRVEIPAEFVAALELDVPAGLGTVLEGDLVIGPSDTGRTADVAMSMKVFDRSETVLAKLPFETEQITTGASGGRIRWRDKSGALTIEAKYDISNNSLGLRWIYSQPDVYSPLDLLPAVKLVAALETGDRAAVDLNGVPMASGTIGLSDPSEFGEFAVWFADVLEHLVIVQMKTGTFFAVRRDLTPDEVDDIFLASRLLRGKEVMGTWDTVTITVLPEGITAVEGALGGLEVIHDIQVAHDMSISVMDETVAIGRVVRVFKSARVHAWEEATDGAPPGTTKLYLAPADTNDVSLSLATVSEEPGS